MQLQLPESIFRIPHEPSASTARLPRPMKTTTSLIRKLTAATALLLTAMTATSSAQTTATDPVGFVTLNVTGTGGTLATAVTFLGLGMARPVAYQGVADTVAGVTITSNSATWTDNQFASTPAPGYFLEVTSGTQAGMMSMVVSCDQAGKTLTVSDDLTAAGVASGVSFKLRPNWSLATLFGSANAAGFGAGTTSTADTISIYDATLGGGAGGYHQYFYSSGGLPGVGWRKVGGGNSDQANTAIWLDDGLVVTRKQSANLAIVVNGAVKLGATITPVILGPNFIGNVYPSGSITLGTSGLYTGNAATGVAPGNSSSADLLLIYNQTLGGGVGGYDQYFYSSGGLPGVGWRKIGAGNAPQDTVSLDSGKSIVIKRNSGGAFNWLVSQPFPNQ